MKTNTNVHVHVCIHVYTCTSDAILMKGIEDEVVQPYWIMPNRT